jgi:hypothetical protein
VTIAVGWGVATDRAGPGGVEGAAVGGRGAGGLGSGTEAHLRETAAARGGGARPADGVRPRQRPLGIPPDPRRERPPEAPGPILRPPAARARPPTGAGLR